MGCSYTPGPSAPYQTPNVGRPKTDLSVRQRPGPASLASRLHDQPCHSSLQPPEANNATSELATTSRSTLPWVKKSANEFFRPGYLTSKKLRQKDLISSKVQSWTQGIVERRTIEGKKYFQIAIPSNLNHAIGEPMLYRVNELPGFQKEICVKNTGESFEKTEPMIDVDDVAASTNRQARSTTLKALEEDGLGILEAYPHLISKEVLTKSSNKAGIAPSTIILTNTGHASKVPDHASKPRRIEFAIIPSANTASGSEKRRRQGVRQGSTVTPMLSSKSNVLRVHGLPSRTASTAITMRSSSIVNAGPVPINALTRPDASIKRPSKNAVERTLSLRPSAYASRDGLSERSSMQSAIESFQNEARTDTASGVVMDAGNPEVHYAQDTAGYCNAPLRRPPKPGPAPTRALPLLPESNDVNADVFTSASRSRKGPTCTRANPGRSRLHAHPASSQDPHVHVQSNTDSFAHQDMPTLVDNDRSIKPSRCRLPTSTLVAQSGSPVWSDASNQPCVAPEAFAKQRRRRNDTRRVVKMRDLEQTQTRPENKKRDEGSIQPTRQAREKSEDSPNAKGSIKESYNSQNPPNGESSQQSRIDGSGSIACSRSVFSRRSNNMSPTLLVMEQEPTSGKSRTGAGSQLHQRKTTQFNVTTATGAHIPPRSTSPSLPSSDDEGSHRHKSTRTKRTVSNTWTTTPVKPLNKRGGLVGSRSRRQE